MYVYIRELHKKIYVHIYIYSFITLKYHCVHKLVSKYNIVVVVIKIRILCT